MGKLSFKWDSYLHNFFTIGDFSIQFSIYTSCRIHHEFWAWGACDEIAKTVVIHQLHTSNMELFRKVNHAISLKSLKFSWYDTEKNQVTSGILLGTPLESVPYLVCSWWLTTVFVHNFIRLILLRRFESLNLLNIILTLQKAVS